MTEEQRLGNARIAEQDYSAAVLDAADRVKIQHALADRMLQALLIANGGGLIGLFTFVGNVAASKSAAIRFEFLWLHAAFALFVAGLIFGLAAHVAGFVSQDRFYNQAIIEIRDAQRNMLVGGPRVPGKEIERFNAQGLRAYKIGVGLAVISTIAFAAGCGAALIAVQG